MTRFAVAALPMYDFPEVRGAVNSLWDHIRHQLASSRIAVPTLLDRRLPLADLLVSQSLLLAQCCGAHVVRDPRLRVLGVAGHALPGCEAGRYHSAIVVRAADLERWRIDPVRALDDAVLAVNEPGSHSGRTALLHWLSERLSQRNRAFPTRLTGAHRASLAALRDGSAELAAIDAVSFALIERHAPAEVEGLAVLDRSAAAPALPYVTAEATSRATDLALRRALATSLGDPATAAARDTLFLSGFFPRERSDYAEIAAMEQEVVAARLTLALGADRGAAGATA